ncbi:MAG: PEP-CTERM sorting domain-containing protein [Deltaproteobacteria bacterium]|nr:PEP-CTERM sorting domain-containing protein [Deltaproteobacteria bacterium]
MSSKIKRVTFTWFLSLFLIFTIATGAYAYSSILAFGDSLSDNGIYELYTGGTAGNTNPDDVYGFMRFSNGPVWVEYMAQNMGIPYTSLLDMAYGGATTGWDNPAAGLPITGLQWQVFEYNDQFGGYISPDTLVTVWAGGNDMFNGRSPDVAAQNIALAIQNLIFLGGKTFLVPNLIISGNNAAWMEAFDIFLLTQLCLMNLVNPGIDFYLLDWNKVDLDGLAADNIMMPDGIHPTTAHHERIAQIAWTQIPEPASVILLIFGFAGLITVKRKMR